MAQLQQTLQIRTSPHVAVGASVDTIMQNVVWALLPVAAFGVYAFGWAALATLVVATGSCTLTEHVACRMTGKRSTVGDASVLVTGLLYGLTLPPSLPLWMTALGGVVAVGLGKSLFGGLGYNPFNPALVGRAFLQAAFPLPMTQWMPGLAAGRFDGLPASSLAWPFMRPETVTWDGFSGATALSAWKFDRQPTDSADLALGLVSGSTGETCAVLIVLGGIYLAVRRMLNWRIPVGILATVAALSGALHLVDPERYASPPFMLFSGGVMLGAVFMATDMVASPMTSRGTWLYGVLIGALIVVIRAWGGMPEGVMYAILLGNAVSPHIDRAIRPVPYGTRPRKAA